MEDAALFKSLGDTICVSNFSPGALANVLFAFAQVGIRHDALFARARADILENRGISSSSSFSEDQMSKVIRSFVKFGIQFRRDAVDGKRENTSGDLWEGANKKQKYDKPLPWGRMC